MIDSNGYRANVGIILTNGAGKVFWAKRVGQDAWQFPQGGMKMTESPEEAMFRELREETGLSPNHVEVLGSTRDWLRYDLPKRYIRRNQSPRCIGQKQIWFMLKMLCEESCVALDACEKPEFDHWCWVDYWKPCKQVIFFKRDVYQEALSELAPLLARRGLDVEPVHI
ncbi:MAG: RNA pyrophosphohydrolase [Pseudomonadota bacterium]